MALTRSQVKQFRAAEAALQQRKPVLFTGKSNGKTTLIHQALEVLAQRDERLMKDAAPLFSSRPKHPEDSTIEYIPRIYFSNQSVTVPHIARQVLTFAGLFAGRTTGDVMKNFDTYLRAAADRGRIICLAIDNAELIPAKAYSVLKALNEYHDPVKRRTIGVGLLVAGDATSKSFWRRMPENFRARCAEVAVGKIGAEEVRELIDILYPGNAQYFGEAALVRMAKCQSNLAMKNVIDRCIFDQRQYRLTEIGSDLVEEKLTDLALAA